MNRSERRRLRAAERNGHAPARSETPKTESVNAESLGKSSGTPARSNEPLKGQRVRKFRCQKGHEFQVAEPLRPNMTNAMPDYCPGCVQAHYASVSAPVEEVE